MLDTIDDPHMLPEVVAGKARYKTHCVKCPHHRRGFPPMCAKATGHWSGTAQDLAREDACPDGRFGKGAKLTALTVGRKAVPKAEIPWGPASWASLHHRPFAVADLAGEAAWVASFVAKLPCGECRRDGAAWVADNAPDLTSAEAYFRWGASWHNAVNRKLGRPEWSEEKARGRWEVRNYFARCYVVSLSRTPDRLAAFWERFPSDWPFTVRPEHWPAVDGTRESPRSGWKDGGPAWGLNRTYVAILKELVAEKVDGPVLILEDDCAFVDGATSKLLAFVSAIPADAAIGFVGGQHFKPATLVAPGVVRCGETGRTHGWIVFPAYQEELLDLWETYNGHVDWGLQGAAPDHNFYAAEPFLAIQAENFSTITYRQEGPRSFHGDVPAWTSSAKVIDPLGLTLVRARVGYGDVGLNGRLGLSVESTTGRGKREYTFHVTPPQQFPPSDWHTIGAHADSEIRVRTERPLRVAAFLNTTANRDPSRPVEFTADWNFVGTAVGPGDATAVRIVPAGEHVLRASVRGATGNGGRHAVWALAECVAPAPPPSAGATPENTAVVTIAQYKPEQMSDRIGSLARSAARSGVWLHVFGVGEVWGGSFLAVKVRRLLAWVESLPASYTHVLYLDGRDTLFARPLTQACEAFNARGVPILAGAERGCWPEESAGWADRFLDVGPAGRWLNAGVFFGKREAVVEALKWMNDLSSRLGAQECPAGLEDLWGFRGRREDDQHLWQCLLLKRPDLVALDGAADLAANLTTQSLRIGPANEVYDFAEEGPTFKASGGRPSVLHFSGEGAAAAIDAWAGWLGLA